MIQNYKRSAKNGIDMLRGKRDPVVMGGGHLVFLRPTVKRLMFVWDLFREFRDRLIPANFKKTKPAFTCTSITKYTSDSQR